MAERDQHQRFTLVLEAMPVGNVPGMIRLRRALKVVWRCFGLRCIEAKQVPQIGGANSNEGINQMRDVQTKDTAECGGRAQGSPADCGSCEHTAPRQCGRSPVAIGATPEIGIAREVCDPTELLADLAAERGGFLPSVSGPFA